MRGKKGHLEEHKNLKVCQCYYTVLHCVWFLCICIAIYFLISFLLFDKTSS